MAEEAIIAKDGKLPDGTKQANTAVLIKSCKQK